MLTSSDNFNWFRNLTNKKIDFMVLTWSDCLSLSMHLRSLYIVHLFIQELDKIVGCIGTTKWQEAQSRKLANSTYFAMYFCSLSKFSYPNHIQTTDVASLLVTSSSSRSLSQLVSASSAESPPSLCGFPALLCLVRCCSAWRTDCQRSLGHVS